METSRQTILVLTTLFLCVSACQKKQPSSSSQDHATTSKTPDLMMEKMHVQNYGSDGLSWELRAPRANAFTKENKMVADNLVVTLLKQEKVSTTISADKGTFNSGDMSASTFSVGGLSLNPGDMFLEGHVVAISTEGNKLITDWAHYQRSLGLIVSSAPVQVIREDSVTNGMGLEATADLSHIKIFHQTVVIKEREPS